ncbi:MAG TPA: S8 family serine peptidase [Polyangiales bacterium]|nr:S8 family serine peptidase [Polyangiales bacterium]
MMTVEEEVGRAPVSSSVDQQLASTGFAQVIVVLNQTRLSTKSRNTFSSSFSVPETSLDAALVRHALARRGGTSSLRASASKSLEAPAYREYPNLGVALGYIEQQGLKTLRQSKDVVQVFAAPPISLIRPASRAAATEVAKITWGIDRMGVPRLWNQGITGKGIRVGHLDTGADGEHPALRGAFADFANFDDLGRERRVRPYDTDDHGTHTAGTIAGRAVKGRRIGVAPEAMLVSGIVIEGGNVIARVLGGMDWALGLGIKVLSMSLGFRGYVEDFRVLTSIVRSRGVLPVFAVGNEGAGTSRSPGNYPEALSVGASDRKDFVAEFSGSQTLPIGRCPKLVAPGVDVVSAMPGGGYQEMDGSSMATPHIAGLAALLFQAKPSATPDEVEAAIIGSAQRSKRMREERAGAGLPDAVRAFELLTGKTLQPPVKVSTRKKATRKKAATPAKKRKASK